MTRYIVLALSLFITGCGVDVATTAATVAAAKAEEAKQAQKTQEHIQKQIDEAMVARQQQLEKIDQANP